MHIQRRHALTLHASTLAIAAALSIAPAAHAAEAAATAATVADAAPVAGEVIVTGTRVTGVKAVDSAAPVVVLGSDSLKRVGQPDLVQSLAQNIPSIQAQVSGGNEESFNLSLKLRGLSPNQTLVLVNGKRRHGTAILAVSGGPYGGGAAADLAYLPVAAIDHVEVLQDGAAAQYGTDAIAGVINIILKKNSHGGNLSASGGQYYDGGGLTSDFAGTIGLAPSDKAFLDLSFESKFRGTSFRGDIDPRGINTGTPANVSANILPRYPTLTSAPNYPYINRIEGDGELQLNTFTYNGGYDVSSNLRLYSFSTIGTKDGRHIQNVRLPNVAIGPGGQVAFPAGFSPTIQFRENDFAVTVGAEGAVNDTTWDLSSTYGRSDARVYVTGSTNASLFAYVADGRNGLKVIQLTAPDTQPKFYGFSPEPKPQLIAWRETGSPALALSRGLERDRGVDETGGQVAVFGRIGSRPFNLEEQRRMYLKPDLTPWTVRDRPQSTEFKP